MYLQNIKLWNFRKYGNDSEMNLEAPNLDVDFYKGLNLIIGENDSGKTAIIDAIKLVLKTSSNDWIRISDDDFYLSSSKLRIEIVITEFSVEAAAPFLEYLTTTGDIGQQTHELKLIFEAERYEAKIKSRDVQAAVDGGKVILAELREKLKVTYLKPLRDAKSVFP